MGVTPPMFTPTDKFQLNQRVNASLVVDSTPMSFPGHIAGIAWRTVLTCGFIVILDTPLTMKGFEGWGAICLTPDLIHEV